MKSGEPVLGYRDLIGEVRRLCAEGRTGTVFITTSDNHSVRFVLRSGAITAMVFGLQTGLAAMTSIKRITAGRLSYSEELPQRAPQEELPPTPELLTLLGGGMAPDAADDGGPSAGTVATSLNRSRAILETELVEYLGPMARVVCNEHLTRAARGGSTSVNDVIEGLASELGDPEKAARFKERVRARLADTTVAND
ncbi:MAG: hypothetical protein AUH29_08180 [Candidatus Rokubacteria bacterium 13_1_40CM_69_27]|nr:MAG: hypothetical protein AUH29_08180 [Candidatus Rokubacteria bacterium 13_1_40CM_69_27]OLE39603.1 MAG: hypothetical protein AUG00_01525 [Candidatus Rokubacteria bacterium 13_1_20CM_2_70_7]